MFTVRFMSACLFPWKHLSLYEHSYSSMPASCQIFSSYNSSRLFLLFLHLFFLARLKLPARFINFFTLPCQDHLFRPVQPFPCHKAILIFFFFLFMMSLESVRRLVSLLLPLSLRGTNFSFSSSLSCLWAAAAAAHLLAVLVKFGHDQHWCCRVVVCFSSGASSVANAASLLRQAEAEALFTALGGRTALGLEDEVVWGPLGPVVGACEP